ncbi:hypothetical protein EMIHUDRAFT_448618 [Emiliania huxleyi CCMP1516]|uniref:Uncharacterized protein n=2 Tax=Emiliania huxleyi TaxID=2903 RepID=A0A0D3I254_EMIH1|nr:hypothetical protein EMIHUDRAFT_448618 [Emiliania huxleyi CCMP1516]EOD05339.1 hypothetical protein EMIHUDRAFT_448618 [Emiliania huxleyi CCMP1516]|eukprot:XP_005757768.1 hypothetical protein EMIHUDRAFT_448618 [Emiliania huxleyi CCMP1516]
MDSAALRTITLDHRQYFVAASAVPGGGVQVALTDGADSWSGTLPASELTPPNRMDAADYARRLRDGLLGRASAVGDHLELELVPPSERKLAIRLPAEGSPGETARAMAARLARHVSELQAEVEDGDEAERRLADEAGQVHALRAGVLCAQAEAVPEARKAMMEALNRIKLRCSRLDAALERYERGGDSFGALSEAEGSPSESDHESGGGAARREGVRGGGAGSLKRPACTGQTSNKRPATLANETAAAAARPADLAMSESLADML